MWWSVVVGYINCFLNLGPYCKKYLRNIWIFKVCPEWFIDTLQNYHFVCQLHHSCFLPLSCLRKWKELGNTAKVVCVILALPCRAPPRPASPCPAPPGRDRNYKRVVLNFSMICWTINFFHLLNQLKVALPCLAEPCHAQPGPAVPRY